MRLTLRNRPAAMGVVLFGLVAAVQATPIIYVETGTASGTIGSTNFTNALVTVTMSGDTANVVSVFTGMGCSVCFANPTTTTVTIAGVGTATITDPTEASVIGTPVSIDTGFPVLPYVVLGTIDSPPDLESLTGIGFQGDNALLNYDLISSIGPITGTPGGGFGAPCCVINTDLGVLDFSTNGSPTTTGTFQATVLPEPSSLLFLGSGLMALAGLAFAKSRYRTRIKETIRPA
jgi:hypothetical protein